MLPSEQLNTGNQDIQPKQEHKGRNRPAASLPERFLQKIGKAEEAKLGQQDKEELAKLRGNLGLEREAVQELSQARKIFENVYNQIAAGEAGRKGSDKKAAAGVFVDELKRNQAYHINKIENISLEDSIQKIWIEGMGRKLAQFTGDPKEFEKRKEAYSKMYLKLRRRVEQLIQSGEVDLETVKVFLENFRTLKMSGYYNDITRGGEMPTGKARESYDGAFRELYSGYKKDRVLEQENGDFFHFNHDKNGDSEVKNRYYLSANLSGRAGDLISAWQKALGETGMQNKIYFKLSGALNNRQETIVVYQTDNILDSEMGKVIEMFNKLCPQEARAEKDMPSSVPITRGISYAPEPKNLNNLFRAMDLRDPHNEDKYLAVSYNEMIAGLVQLSFEQAYRDAAKSGNRNLTPKQLKKGAEKYFEQMIKLVGINPETMVPNAQGGKLPEWAQKLQKKYD